MKNNKILVITQTAVFLALLLVVQYVSKPLGQMVTGSLVNFVLIAAVVMGGVYSGIITAAVSPFLASMLGIGPALIQIVPLIALGNMALVLVYAIVFKKYKDRWKAPTLWMIAAVGGAILKFLTLYLGIVKLILPTIAALKEAQFAVLAAAFGWMQLMTALIGGVLAFLIVPTLEKALKNKN